MSGLAVVAHALGASVTGSDRAAGSPYAATLRAAGIEPAIGHDAANVPEGAEVVYSSAIPPTNPERRAPEMHRADLLGELTRLKPTIAVSGTHGKTTTSSMLVHALRAPTQLPGRRRGPLAPAPTPAGGRGSGSWSRPTSPTARCSSSRPTIAVVTNAELDHHTTYASAARRRRHVPRLPGARAGQQVVPGPTLVRGSRRATRPVASTRRRDVDARRPRRPQRAQRRGGADRDPARRRGRRARPRSAGRLRGRRPALRAARARPRAARSSSTTTPTTRPRSARRSTPRARSRPAAWSPASSRTCSRARSARRARSGRAGRRRPRRGPRRLSRARARGGLPGRQRPARRRGDGRRGRRQARRLDARPRRRRGVPAQRKLQTATCC